MPEKTLDDRAEKGVTMVSGHQEAPQNVSKHHHIVPTSAPILDVPSTSSTSSSY